MEGTYGMVASGLVTYDELGRTVEQGQPVFQSGGDIYGYLRQSIAKNPARTAYDPLDRTVRIETPDSRAAGGYAVTTTDYGFGKMNNSNTLYATTKVVDPIGVAASEANRKGTKISFKDVDDRIAAVVEYNHGAPIIISYDYDPLRALRDAALRDVAALLLYEAFSASLPQCHDKPESTYPAFCSTSSSGGLSVPIFSRMMMIEVALSSA